MPKILRREDGCTPMNKRRLRLLASFLSRVIEKVPAERFRMNSFVHASEAEAEQFAEKRRTFLPTRGRCETAACALGWAPSEPNLRKEGIRISMGHSPFANDSLTVKFGNDSGLSAGMSFFGLTEEEADWLFIPSLYNGPITPKRVAERIRKLIKLGGVPLRSGRMDLR